ncbi:MAG: hypothetical protein K6A43_05495 [Treponema sp.]|nr:hypothetical protein [Treponema sp.]
MLFVLQFNLTGYEYKYYYDKTEGYSGYSYARYDGTLKSLGVKEVVEYAQVMSFRLSAYIPQVPIGKMSAEESFLVWSALNEYDYKQNEVYFVQLNYGKKQHLDVYVCIKEHGKAIDYVALSTTP